MGRQINDINNINSEEKDQDAREKISMRNRILELESDYEKFEEANRLLQEKLVKANQEIT